MLKKLIFLITFISLSFSISVQAQPTTSSQNQPTTNQTSEGMWLPISLNFDDMVTLGLTLSEDDIYSEDQPSLKDAIVQLGGFCTGEMISPQGLMLTNHHCGYDAIAEVSTVENDYLTDGFWAAELTDEKPIAGLTATFLVRMEDVTEKVLGDDRSETDEMTIQNRMNELESETSEGTDYKVEVKSVFHGAEYYLYVYEVFRDIRLVGAPPSSIGKYGGDTDNWMWPRHTGDFSLFRVYAGADNKPADYAESNVPYKPKHFLPISLKGVEKSDYAMIMGYPGSTDRYLTAAEVDFNLKVTNQDIIKLAGQKLDIMKEAMDADDEIRINLASDYASLANTWKYFIGQTKMLKRYDMVSYKQGEERKYQQWAEENNNRKAKYGTVLDDIKGAHEGYDKVQRFLNYFNFGTFAATANVYAIQYYRLHRTMAADQDASAAVDALKGGLDEHFSSFYFDIDKQIYKELLKSMNSDLPADMKPEVLNDIINHKKAKKGSNVEEKIEMWVDWAFDESLATDQERAADFLDNPKFKTLDEDPIVNVIIQLIDFYRNNAAVQNGMFTQKMDILKRTYIEGLREMHADKKFYPDANFTMRVTYGTVVPYYPQDAVFYDFQTTLEGVMEKEDPNNDEFIVPQRLKDLYKRKSYGDYAMANGELPVNFLSTNDITGGNSGSPVINANGELIGCAFDGNWEAMASDIHVFQDVTRTISVDARYILFIIDKFAGSKRLIEEMDIRK